MLQGVRDNMKGTLVAVVVLLFVIPMVLSGIGGSFLGSVAGTDAASVNGETISKAELRREIYMQKQRMLSQPGVDPSSDMLKDENLEEPVLNQLTRKTALIVAAKESGMAAPETLVGKEIAKTEEFFTDGKFDATKYKNLIANVGYTPATYQSAISDEIILNQNGSGLRQTSFVTQAEMEAFTALLHQKRSFFTVKIPKGEIEKTVTVDEAEIKEFYEDNQDDFIEPESVSIEYLELSVDELMKSITVDEADVKALFDEEQEKLDLSPEVEIAHILIEKGSDKAEERIAQLKTKLSEGTSFEDLAKEYSDDAGSKDSGGVLGMLSAGFPEEFKGAVSGLEVDAVSEPVETDAGTHFLKVLKKTVPEPPTFESQKVALEDQIKRNQAEEIFVANLEALGDLTYSASDLKAASDELNLEIKKTDRFTMASGVGIALETKVREAAFDQDVLEDGHNSPVIEVSNAKAVVLRKLEHKEQFVKDLKDVTEQIKTSITSDKVTELLAQKAESFVKEVDSVETAEAKAKEANYEFAQHEEAKRTDPIADYMVREKAFSMPAPEAGKIEISSDKDNQGGYLIVGLTSVAAGTLADVEKQQLRALEAQVASQQASSEISAYQTEVVDGADVKVF